MGWHGYCKLVSRSLNAEPVLTPAIIKKGAQMLTNFITEAANDVYFASDRSVTPGTEETEQEGPVIVRNTGTEKREARVTDIYDRARVIYFRAKRPNRARAANIL
jgi:hypothetical protein